MTQKGVISPYIPPEPTKKIPIFNPITGQLSEI
jgi:hypothetical protein